MDGSSFVPAEPVHIFLTNIQWLLSMSQTWITAVSCLSQGFIACMHRTSVKGLFSHTPVRYYASDKRSL